MSFNGSGNAPWRNNPFTRSGSQSPASTSAGRPKSVQLPSPSPLASPSAALPHDTSHTYASLTTSILPHSNSARHGRTESRNGTPSSSTFAPSFIKSEDMRRSSEPVNGIEGENDFSGKRYVWLKDPQEAFVKGWIVEDLEEGRILVQCDDGSVRLLFRTKKTFS